jgi:hypothetical protein
MSFLCGRFLGGRSFSSLMTSMTARAMSGSYKMLPFFGLTAFGRRWWPEIDMSNEKREKGGSDVDLRALRRLCDAKPVQLQEARNEVSVFRLR